MALRTDKILLWVIRSGIFLLLFTPLIVSQLMFFPFITGKNFFFRIIVEIIFAAWVALAMLRPEFRPRKSPVLIALGLFLFALIIATIFGADPYHSFWSNFERMDGLITHLHLFALFLLLSHTLRAKEDWLYILYGTVAVSVIVAFVALFEKLDVITLFSKEDRPFGPFGNFIYLAVYLMVHLFITAGFFAKERHVKWKVLWGSIFFFELYIFSLAASRGAFLGLISGVGIIALALIFLMRSGKARTAGIVFIALLALFVGSMKMFPRSPIFQSNALLARTASTLEHGIGKEPRVMIWGIALEAFQERPILGWGPENFIIPYGKYYNPQLYGNEPWFDRAHNVYLEWLVAAGVVGLLFYMSIFAVIFLSLWKIWRSRKLEVIPTLVIAGGIVAYMVQNIFVFDTITTYLSLFFLMAFLHTMTHKEQVIPRPAFPVFTAARARAMITIPLSALFIAIFSVYFFNAKPVLAARHIITFLRMFPDQRSVEDISMEFDKVAGYGTFGTTEIRERLADTLSTIALNTQQNNDQFAALLQKGIEEMRKETTRRPFIAKNHLFLARLYLFHERALGNGASEGIAHLKEAQELAPQYVPVYLSFAELYLASGEYEKLVQSMEKAFALTGRSSRLLAPMLSAYLISSNIEQAEKLLQEFVDKDKVLNITSEEMSQVARNALRVSDSARRLRFLNLLRDYHSNAASNALLHLIFAQTYADLGNTKQAIQEARRAAELDASYQGMVDIFINSLK